ncbi:hypothetical protein ZWY2020_050443 [Hordeum vulgare]|nr:hypothetical protein ZWY2020_050443 [Hordeum vulgare]
MSSSDSDEGAKRGNVWPSSLTVGQTEDLARFGLYVPLSAKLSRPCRIFVDGFPTLGPPVTDDELCRHNRKGRRHFWHDKKFDDDVGAFNCTARGLPVEISPGERVLPAAL